METEDLKIRFLIDLKELLLKYDAIIEIEDHSVEWDRNESVIAVSLNSYSINFDLGKCITPEKL